MSGHNKRFIATAGRCAFRRIDVSSVLAAYERLRQADLAVSWLLDKPVHRSHLRSWVAREKLAGVLLSAFNFYAGSKGPETVLIPLSSLDRRFHANWAGFYGSNLPLVEVKLIDRVWFFGYHLEQRAEQALAFQNALAAALGLPIRSTIDADGTLRVEHLEGLALDYVASKPGKVLCAIPNATASTVLGLVRQFDVFVGAKRQASGSWGVASLRGASQTEVETLYDALRDLAIPSSSGDVTFTFALSDVRNVVNLGALCTKGGELFSVQLCSLDLGEGATAVVEVQIKKGAVQPFAIIGMPGNELVPRSVASDAMRRIADATGFVPGRLP